MILRVCLLVLLVASLPASADDVFSPAFREKVERAFQSPTTEGRIALLTDSVRSGSDSEVARAVGVYFPDGILGTARNDSICVAQVDALLDVMRTAARVGTEAYFVEHADGYRQRLIDAIACVHLAYADGIPVARLRDTPSGQARPGAIAGASRSPAGSGPIPR